MLRFMHFSQHVSQRLVIRWAAAEVQKTEQRKGLYNDVTVEAPHSLRYARKKGDEGALLVGNDRHVGDEGQAVGLHGGVVGKRQHRRI